MNGKTVVFIFDPDAWIGFEETLEVGVGALQRPANSGWQRRLGVALPPVQAVVVDAGDANVFEEFGPAAAADDHKRCAAVTREPAQDFSRGGRKADLVGARHDVDQRPVKIEKNSDALVCPNF